jgi:DNA repair protein RecN (Recombination protein N)
MIKSFRIKNLATIEDVEIDLEEGFSILTGETGAGKSIIIDGIRLVLGEKGSPDLIRTGKKETSIEAVFQFASDKIDLKDFPTDQEDEVFISRTISARGTGKVHLNGILVPIKRIKSLKDNLVDIYGQNDHVFLRYIEYQLDYLDFYADAIFLRQQVSEAAHELRRLIREKKGLEAKTREREQRIDFLNFQINEIEKAKLQSEEEYELRKEREILKSAEKISMLIEQSLSLTYEEETSISSLLSKLQNVVHELSRYDESFKIVEEAIAQFAITIGDFSDSLLKFREKHEGSPEKLEKLEERLSLIESLKRKYGNSIPEILRYLEKAKKDVQELSVSHERLSELDRQIEKTFTQYESLCQHLAEKRKNCARQLEKTVEKEISNLGMKRAQFKIVLDSSPLERENIENIRDKGTEEVEFLISPNPGEEVRPLRKIASGGELSRIMLALKSIGKETETLKTLIFDEIDSGIGGKTAEFVAQKLSDLAKQHQVVCITHLPQIASFATHHYRIEKKIEKNRTFTKVKKLSFDERVEEIARLLTGSRITETALKNAREMLVHNLNQS